MITPRASRAARIVRRSAAMMAAALIPLAGPIACGEPSDDTVLDVSRVMGETGTQPGQFRYPRGMDSFEIDGRTHLAVVDKTSRIQLLDLISGEPVGSLRTPKSDLGMPTGLSVAPFPGEPGTQALWVADTHNHQVIIYKLPFDHAGAKAEPVFAFGTYGYGPGEFIYPTDIAVRLDDDGSPETVFVSEYGGNDRISAFRVDSTNDTPSMIFERQIGISGVAMDAPEDDPAALARPQTVQLRRDGTELIVSDAGRHRIVRFDTTTGEPIAWTDGSMNTNDEPVEPLRFPYGLSLVNDDIAAVAEFGGSRIRLIEIDSGRTIRVIGGPGRTVGQIATPWSAAVIDDELVVLDSGNDRIQVVEWTGVGR